MTHLREKKSDPTPVEDASYGFDALDQTPPDALFEVGRLAQEARRKNPHALMIGLFLGYLRDQNSQPFTFPSVVEAKRFLGKGISAATSPEYLGQAGDVEYNRKTLELIFNNESPLFHPSHSDRMISLGTPGGTGGLFLAGELFKELQEKTNRPVHLFYGDPAWPNYPAIFEKKYGFDCHTFQHEEDKRAITSDFLATLKTQKEVNPDMIPVVLLQGACHNPTGFDYSKEQIQEIAEFLKEMEAYAIVDMAYHGLGDGFEEDSYMARYLTSKDIPTVITYSYSKNASLYQDRAGLFAYFGRTAEEASKVLSFSKNAARTSYSNPSAHGEMVMRTILSSPDLTDEWMHDVESARRDLMMRRQKIDELTQGTFPSIAEGKGFLRCPA